MKESAYDPLVIKRLEFIGPMASPTGWRPEAKWPEVAFAGRSPCGKSAPLNQLIRRKRLARVSNTPGRTRAVNFFLVTDRFVLVDLPGYGYARISKERRAEWKPLIEGYLRSSRELRGVVQLLDVRHDPTDDDRQMLAFLGSIGIPTLFALTKIDKLASSRRTERIASLVEQLALSEDQVIPFSAVTGEGRDDLAESVIALLEQPAWRAAPTP